MPRLMGVALVASAFILALLAVLDSNAQDRQVPASSYVALHMMQCGLGPSELAALGYSGPTTADVLQSIRDEPAALESIQILSEQISELESQIRGSQSLLRERPSEHAALRTRLDADLVTLADLESEFTAARGSIRDIVISQAELRQALAARISGVDAVARRLPAPWRANQNTDARKIEIAGALALASAAEAAGEPTPPEAMITIAQEQARTDTALALTNHTVNAGPVGAVFLEWIRSTE